ncbi:MAG: tonB terminal family protein, partial [Burkholderiaceae bacterium]|nr:tonB terminal family protein [Burkholderiaceae bacterium]
MQPSSQNNRMLAVALGVSLAVHALALAVRFVNPDLLRMRSTDPALEIILVNARSQARPSQPEAHAQANLDGGGANDAGRRSSPLPNLMQQREGEALEKAQARAEQARQQPQKLA